MTFCWFAHATGDGVSAADLARVADIIARPRGLSEALLFTPTTTHDPYLHDGPPPMLALQLYFDGIEALEAALAAAGPLSALAELPSLAGATVIQQAMLARSFAVPDPVFRTPPKEPHCTYLVAYEGGADDLPAWLAHYIASHAAIMARFPDIRQVEICTRIDWIGALPWPRADFMQRNKVVFDDAAALTAALNSAVRHEMRADFAKFPHFTGPVSHYPMATRVIRPA